MQTYQIEDETGHEVFPGFQGHLVHGSSLTVAHWIVAAGATVPAHSHVHEQIVHVLEGTFDMTIGGEEVRLGPASMAVIPSGVVHSGTALTSCRIVDCFSPTRDDYRF